ncbi:hypothetical protein GCM10011529_09640 [Polymorphobacter glacialis]|uniref:Uncharacterized protein n=1 Tax=Sandarakinorhabdus glacialis TaxID=1614636 RepID=A0A916ZP80_9SPHN|nr:hypothetical protein [Polymorphobacter glacialis]GGE05308.1 hypothetical protein GCM10011529_09640 [Polymorphobacter glacialis]
MAGHVPPKAVADAAALGLELRAKFKRGGTDVGVKRAEQLKARRECSDADIAAISSYFKRHVVDKDAKAHEWGDNDDPSAGYVAWLLWGGDAGEKWADGVKAKLDG